jgi:S-adenosylmethionine synthetase
MEGKSDELIPCTGTNKMDEKTIQKPTTQEFNLLKEYYKTRGHPEEIIDKILQNSWYAVFESDPNKKIAYQGRLIVAVYSMIEFHEIFQVENNKIHRIDYHFLNLEQSIQLTSILHTAITAYLQKLGYVKKKKMMRKNNEN